MDRKFSEIPISDFIENSRFEVEIREEAKEEKSGEDVE